MRYYALLILLCLAAFLPGNSSLPPIDRDEPRFMQASRQMAETGDFVDIRFQDESRYKKPIGIYWLQSAAVMLSGEGADAPIWVYRLVSLLGGIIAVCGTFAIGRSLFGTRAGLISAIALIGIVGLGFEARIAKTDAFLTGLTVVAQGALASLYLASRQGRSAPGHAVWLFWVAQACGILIKGPILPLISALTVASVVVLDRDRSWLRNLKPVRGLLVILLIAAPWIAAISTKVGWAFWEESVGKDMLGKVASGQEAHGFPPGYYVITYALFTWPFGWIALDGGLAALKRFRTDPRLLFLIAWYIPWWIVCELLPTKLPHYMLPAYPAILLLVGWRLTSPEPLYSRRWEIWLMRLARFGVAVVAVGLAVLAVALPLYFDAFTFWSIPCALAFLVGGWMGAGRAVDRTTPGAIAVATVASFVGLGLMAGKVLPAVDYIWPSRQIARTFEANRPCPDSRLASAGYDEPSVVFLTRTDTLLADGAEAAGLLAADACAIAAVDASQQAAFDEAFAGAAAKPVAVAKVDGFNFSNGRFLSITFYRMPAG